MPLSRRITENRPTILFAALVFVSLLSLAYGVQGNWVIQQVRTAVSVVATPFLRAMTGTAQTLNYATTFFTSYSASRDKVETLEAELADRVADSVALADVREENTRLRRMLDFKERDSRLTLKPVKVHVIGRFEGTLSIDQGWAQGVHEAMCAISPNGSIVGVVAKVERSQSFIYTLHHTDCRIGAVIERNRAHGIVRGSGNDFSHICRMEYIDSGDEVLKGDHVVTSGGAVYPSGYPIGTVIEPPQGEGSLLMTALIKPAADPYALDEVFLVERVQSTAEELAGGYTPPTQGDAPEGFLPETESIQERLAP